MRVPEIYIFNQSTIIVNPIAADFFAKRSAPAMFLLENSSAPNLLPTIAIRKQRGGRFRIACAPLRQQNAKARSIGAEAFALAAKVCFSSNGIARTSLGIVYGRCATLLGALNYGHGIALGTTMRH